MKLKIRWRPYIQSIWSPSVMYMSEDCSARYPLSAAIALPSSRERRVVERRHVRGDVRLRVAVRPQDQLAVGVEGDVGADLLDPVDHAAQHEVSEGLRLRRGERVRAPVRERGPVARRAAAPSPSGSRSCG